MKLTNKILYQFLLIILCGMVAHAQETGNIRGLVADHDSHEELPGANVLIEGTVLGASTSLDGSFEIENLAPGTYTLTISLLGYETFQEVVIVKAGQTSELDIHLEPQPVDIGAVLIESERAYSAASSSAIRKFDIRTRPNRSAHDMLQMAPGIIIAQHAGGGKAEQIFIRGFDADHGTDVSIAVDGLPTNMVSHGHGQGYADLHYLIPDIVEAVDVYKGPYFAEFGNLATAGAIRFRTKEHIDKNIVKMEAGEFNTSRLTTLMQIPTGDDHQNAYIAGQFYRTDGPVESPQGFDRFNLFGKLHTHLSPNSKLVLTATAFSSGWDASGQIPQRAVDQGMINRFGTIDDLEGGTTSRQDINLQYFVHGSRNSELMLQTYATGYNFKLFSNFTFFLDNPEEGDMIEQTDKRQILGFNSHYKFTHHLGKGMGITTIGGNYRADDISVGLWQSPDRVRKSALVDADIFERNLSLWAKEEILFSNKFRVQLGLRGDYITYNVEDHLDMPGLANDLPHASGYAQESMLNPKLNMAFSLTDKLDLFINSGSGFHSNDARNVVIGKRIAERVRVFERQGLSQSEIDSALTAQNFDPAQNGVQTFPRAIGAEIGFRTRLLDRVNFAAALWWMDLEREYVFIGDAGTTELSDPTTRTGLDVEARFQLTRWLWGDADVNFSRGTVKDAPADADDIALAPRLTTTGGLTAIHPSGWEGSLRYRHIDDRPANEDGSVIAEGYTVLDFSTAYQIGRVKFHGTIENLLDVDWNEAQFDTESRLFGETESVSEIHFTPGNPRNFRFGITYEF